MDKDAGEWIADDGEGNVGRGMGARVNNKCQCGDGLLRGPRGLVPKVLPRLSNLVTNGTRLPGFP